MTMDLTITKLNDILWFTISRDIIALRQKKRLTKSKLARQAKISYGTINKLEKGEKVQLNSLLKALHALCDPRELDDFLINKILSYIYPARTPIPFTSSLNIFSDHRRIELEVYFYGLGRKQNMGTLYNHGPRIIFEYDRAFLSEKVSPSPIYLPLRAGPHENSDHVFGGLFGLFHDSLPDNWGCRYYRDRILLQHGLPYHAISPLARLSLVRGPQIGAIAYKPANKFTASLAQHIDTPLESEYNLYSIDAIDALPISQPTSLGAQKKIFAWFNGINFSLASPMPDVGYSPWLIKCTSSHGNIYDGVIEYVYSLLARKAGVEIPDTYLFPSNNHPGYFGVKRFDFKEDKKLHIHSASGLLQVSPHFNCIEYEDIIRLTAFLTQSSDEIKKIIRLMIFNVKAKIFDDHSRNFSFLLTEDSQWKFAPAYDLMPSYSNLSTLPFASQAGHFTLVNKRYDQISDNDIIAAATIGGITGSEVKKIIEEVEDAIAELPKLLRDFGLPCKSALK